MSDWREEQRLERAARAKADRRFNIIAGIIMAIIVLAVIALIIWLRADVIPCGWFAIKDAPVRCLVDTGVFR